MSMLRTSLRLKSHQSPNEPKTQMGLLVFKLILLAAFVVLTNPGVGQRVGLLLDNSRLGTLIPFVAIWAVAVLCLIIAAMQPNVWIRCTWAVVLAASSALAWGYYRASQSEFNVFDLLSLWNARHEAGRAADFYVLQMQYAAIVFAIGTAIMVMPARLPQRAQLWVSRLALAPLLPIAAIVAIVYTKSGGGSQALPKAFSPIALASLAGTTIALQGTPERGDVTWEVYEPPSQNSPKQNIVLLMDESIGASFVDLTLGNQITPELAKHADKFVNFGAAVSGGNCSNYSNAILRMAASRSDIFTSINTHPTIWQYAKKAGYRTVFIDAQAGNISNPGLLQNFMTMKEREGIDTFHAIRGVEPAQADLQVAEIVANELKSDTPTFIYANKNGAHFPYDHAYPKDQAYFHPTMAESGSDTEQARLASYRNAVRWSVDHFMAELFARADFSNTTMIYTADHAQIFDPAKLTHCIVDNPEPEMGVVPLMVMTSDAARRVELEEGAKLLQGRASHFQIVPSILKWMGYAPKDIATRFDENLMTRTTRDPAFTSGDVFGLFSKQVFWWPVDLKKPVIYPTTNPSSQVFAFKGVTQ